MRAKEFINEVSPSLANALKTAVMQAVPSKGAANPNATKATTTAQTTQGSMSATQAGAQQSQAGGTKTSPIASPTAPTLGKPGANPNAGEPMGADTEKPGIGAAAPAQQTDISKMPPAQLQATFKPGKTFDIPGLGKLKAGRVTPQGIEFDASASPTLGAKKITVDLKSLSQK